jgi:hypothetical protein
MIRCQNESVHCMAMDKQSAVLVVQRIEQAFPKCWIQVRFLSGILVSGKTLLAAGCQSHSSRFNGGNES